MATRDGDEVILRVRDNGIGIVGLPVVDGYELAQRMRDLPSLRGTRIVALTGYGQASDHRRSAEAGFDAHLVKPGQLSVLEAMIAA